MSATILPPARNGSTPEPRTPGASNLPQTRADSTSISPASAASNVRPTRPAPAPRFDSSAAHIVKDLRLASEKLDAIESARIPLGQLAGDYESKGVLDLAFLAYLRGVEDTLKAEEHQAELQLVRVYRKHPLYRWAHGTVGLGDKQVARFLASLGNADPARNERDDRPRRGPAELWAYCGFAPDQKRRKGERSNWNPTAKMRMRLIAEKCTFFKGGSDKNGKPLPLSPYRAVYDQARVAWADRDTTDGHKHNHALRVVAKEVLKDMWREMNELRGGQLSSDAHSTPAPADLASAMLEASPMSAPPTP